MGRKPKYCYLYMTDFQVEYYSPEHFQDYLSAMHEFEQDAKKWVKIRGYKPEQIWQPGYNAIKRRIQELWQQTDTMN